MIGQNAKMMGAQNGLRFKSRKDAGEQLGSFLEPTYKNPDSLVMGIPRGGIEIAWHVALCLQAELALVVSKKLPLPGHPEYGIGAIAEQHSVYVSPQGKELLSPRDIDRLIEQQEREVKRRVEKYRQGKPLPRMKNRTVILVDDGIATGATLVPVIKLCHKNEAAKVVVAAPVSGTRYDEALHEADEIEILLHPQNFYAVGQAYENFDQVSDEEVMEILSKAKALNNKSYDKGSTGNQ